MNELTKKLMKNEKVFSRLTSKEQACFKKAGKENCVFWGDAIDKWRVSICDNFQPGVVYRIKRDYEPEPEIERCEVFVRDEISTERLCYQRSGCVTRSLTEALNDPDFIHPLDKDGIIVPLRIFLSTDKSKPAPWPKELLFRSKK